MLETLKIKNLAIIDEAEICFKKGLNILSGETGAGKSIVIEAISLVLGGRASSDLVRSGADEAIVEGLFNISKMEWILDRLGFLGFTKDTGDLLIKRVVSRTGRHRIYVNGELCTLSLLQQLSEGLVDLCGQHEHQTLLKAQTQMELLDRYGTLVNAAEVAGREYTHFKSLVSELEALRKASTERIQRTDYLKFQIEELRSAALVEGEDESLQREKKLLQSAEQRLQISQSALELIDGSGEDVGFQDRLHALVMKLKVQVEHDPGLSPILASFERARLELEEAQSEVLHYQNAIESAPGRLEEIQGRLALLAELRRKYGSSISEMIEYLNRAEGELGLLENLAEKVSGLESLKQEAEKQVLKSAKKLSESRKSVAKVFSDSVTQELKELNMSGSKFKVQVGDAPSMEAWTTFGLANTIQFEIQTNKGEDSKSISKIASGGELSRVMLAIRRIISDGEHIGVYLFDEIDAGMGGQTAFQVGKKLKSVSKFNQVICITHLPQVAAFADHHLNVKKRALKNRTVTEIVELKTSERKEEIARMLAGDKLTPASIKNAQELLELTRV